MLNSTSHEVYRNDESKQLEARPDPLKLEQLLRQRYIHQQHKGNAKVADWAAAFAAENAVKKEHPKEYREAMMAYIHGRPRVVRRDPSDGGPSSTPDEGI